jgi:hypothetical protein
MFPIKGKMSVLAATIRYLEQKPEKKATYGELYVGVSKVLGYKVSPDNLRAVVYRKMPTRHKKPAFDVKNSEVILLNT